MLLILCLSVLIHMTNALMNTQTFVGCFADTPHRDLPFGMEGSDSLTVAVCNDFCTRNGYRYFGLQESTRCACGNSYGRYGASNECTFECSGDSSEICGGHWTNSIYEIDTTGATSPPSASDANTSPPAPVPTSSTYRYVGCYNNPPSNVMQAKTQDTKMTIEWCRDYCTAQGTSYFALEAANWCYCFSAPSEYTLHGTSDHCNQLCDGDSSQICGSDRTLSVYQQTFAYVGCFVDTFGRDLPKVIELLNDNSAATCHLKCKEFGYRYFGLQASTWCRCGNSHGTTWEGAECSTPCPGDSTRMCGGHWSNSVYEIFDTDATPEPTIALPVAASKAALDPQLKPAYLLVGGLVVFVESAHVAIIVCAIAAIFLFMRRRAQGELAHRQDVPLKTVTV